MAMDHEPLVGQSEDPNTAGVLGEGVNVGVRGNSAVNAGVLGEGGTGVYGRNVTQTGNGVIGYSDKGRGVWGHSNQDGIGVLGESTNGRGVQGSSQTNYGIRGHSTKIAGIRGSSDESRGVEGWSTISEGVVGISKNGNGVGGNAEGGGIGVIGTSQSGDGIAGFSQNGIGVHGKGGRLAGHFEGNVEVTGNIEMTGLGGDIRMANADCAEDFDVSGTHKVEPGTVMVLGIDGALSASQQAYDKRVAGVISGAGDYKPAIVLDTRQTQGNRQPVALMGKAFCKVDAQFGAIEVGDLLTTSPTPGHAMKTSDPFRAFGAVIGKALRPFADGQGLIPILIALQ